MTEFIKAEHFGTRIASHELASPPSSVLILLPLIGDVIHRIQLISPTPAP
jgi:hypothetical protein